MNKKQNKGGRNPKIDPAVYRYYVRFNSKEHEQFLHMFDLRSRRLSVISQTQFLKKSG